MDLVLRDPPKLGKACLVSLVVLPTSSVSRREFQCLQDTRRVCPSAEENRYSSQFAEKFDALQSVQLARQMTGVYTLPQYFCFGAKRYSAVPMRVYMPPTPQRPMVQKPCMLQSLKRPAYLVSNINVSRDTGFFCVFFGVQASHAASFVRVF